MRNLLAIVFIISLASCSNSKVDQLTAENEQLQGQLIQCQSETQQETARADAAEEATIKAKEEATEARKRASESAAMALEVINRVKNKK